MYQQVWEEKLEWDTPLPEPYVTQHANWRHELPLLAERQQSRCYFHKGVSRVTTQLHGFCDASAKAYAAVVYVRATYHTESPTCALVTAKTRVAPIKPLSIPRLELCGATLLARLLTSVRKALSIPLEQVYAWSDSTIVLSWLNGSPKHFKTFVGNRLSTILHELPPHTWHHVPTSQNPADCASRGLSPRELVAHTLWWDGPMWLHADPLVMPTQPLLGIDSSPELKVVCNVTHHDFPLWIDTCTNNYTKTLRLTAWCRRYISNMFLRKRQLPPNPQLTSHRRRDRSS